MRVLLIDKNLLDPLHRRKWSLLASRTGVELSAICPDRWVENYRPQAFAGRPEDGFPIEPRPVVWPGFENRCFYRHGVKKEVKDFRPDIILSFEEPFSLFAIQSQFAAGLGAGRIPTVFYTWDNRAHGRHFAYRPAQFYAAAERFVVRRASMILTANEEGRTSFATRYSVPVRRLPFGLDLRAFDSSAGGQQSPDPFVIGYVGRLLPMKGIDTLLEAAARLSTTMRIVLLGSGPDRPRLEALVDRLGLIRRTTFQEAVSSEQVGRILGGMSVLVLPSLTTTIWKEQFGRVLVEAMAAGVPVIGSSSGAIPEVIGEAGIVFPEGDAEALADAIEAIHRDRDRATNLRELGRLRSREFSAERFAGRVHDLLAEVLDGN